MRSVFFSLIELRRMTEKISRIRMPPAQFRYCPLSQSPTLTLATQPPTHPLSCLLSLALSTPVYPTANNSQSPSNGQITPLHTHHNHGKEREHGYYKTTIPVGSSLSGSTNNGESSNGCSHCQTRTADVRLSPTNNNNNHNKNAHTQLTESQSCGCSSRVCKNHTTTTTTTLEYELSNFAKLTTRITTQSAAEVATSTDTGTDRDTTSNPNTYTDQGDIATVSDLPKGLPLSSQRHWNQLQRSLHALHHQQQQQQLRFYSSDSRTNLEDNMSSPVTNLDKYAQRDRLGIWGTGDNEVVGSISGFGRLFDKRYSKVSSIFSLVPKFFSSPVPYHTAIPFAAGLWV